MGFHAVTRGRVVGAPIELIGDGGLTTVLLMRDTHALEGDVDYQVFCRKQHLGRIVRDKVRVGDALVVVGEVVLHRVGGPIEEDLPAAWVCVEAMTIARDLDTSAPPSCTPRQRIAFGAE